MTGNVEKVRSYNASDILARVTVRWSQYCGEPCERAPGPVTVYAAGEVRRMRMPEPRRVVYTPPGCRTVTRMDVRFRARKRAAVTFDRLASRVRRLEAA